MELPFKGTASTWWNQDGRVTPVEKLTNPHLVNIFTSLHQVAEKELKKDNPYSTINSFYLSAGEKFTPRQHEIWLLENCITYPALRREAVKRGLWNSNTFKAELATQTKTQESAQAPKNLDSYVSIFNACLDDHIARIKALEAKVSAPKAQEPSLDLRLNHIQQRLDEQIKVMSNILRLLTNRT